MDGSWIRIVIAAAAVGALSAGCGDGETTGAGASGGGEGGSGASGGGGAGGETTGSTTSSSSSSSSTSTTTTAPPGPCDGVIEGFTPVWKPSEGVHQSLCTEAQITDFFAACIEQGAAEADCNAFTDAPENAACAMCAVSAPDDAEYGPMTIYETPQVLYENPGQCVSEIEMDATAESCGAKIFFTIQCQVTACAECMEDFNTLLGCFDAAKAGSCKPHADAEAACVADLTGQGVDIDVCLPPTSGGNAAFYKYLRDMTLFHCGP